MLDHKNILQLLTLFLCPPSTLATSLHNLSSLEIKKCLDGKEFFYKKSDLGIDNDVFLIYKKEEQIPSLVLKHYHKYDEESLERIIQISQYPNKIHKPPVFHYNLKHRYILFRYVHGRHIDPETDDVAIL